MNNKTIIGTLAGAVTMFLLGWILYGMILMDMMTPNPSALESPNLPLIFVANLCYAFTLTYIFQKWAGISTWMGGAQAGLMIGVLLGLSFDLMWMATMDGMTTKDLILDIIGTAVMMTGTGAVIGMVLGSGNKS
jgi:hypothetical protein